MINKVLITMSFLFITMGLFFSAPVLVGNVIGQNLSVAYAGLIFILLGITGFILFARKKKGDLEGQMLFNFEAPKANPPINPVDTVLAVKNEPDYKKFVRDVESRGVPKDKFGWRLTKQKLLEQYFPGQFSKQILASYSDRQVGETFSKVLTYSRNYIKQQSKK